MGFTSLKNNPKRICPYGLVEQPVEDSDLLYYLTGYTICSKLGTLIYCCFSNI